ncbi:MAG TPA: hypothetical protein PLQ88_10945 [Blastocatellia bacterium]|nr:hypothetical protein [Blastocatellia bacterium]
MKRTVAQVFQPALAVARKPVVSKKTAAHETDLGETGAGWKTCATEP